MKKYNHKKIEKKVQEKWSKTPQNSRPSNFDPLYTEGGKKLKFYMLDMFPYPSGDGLHMGHTESYTASDIIYRFKRLQGFDVLHPQGFDSFGLPAENYAIKTGVHPSETTETNASNYIQQMKMLGLGHDLDHLVYTSKPNYYKWTQWIFGKFFENGLVEQKTDKINWCSSCQTGIANEQVENGACERCKTEIEQKEVPGWFFKITDFADDLIKDLDKVDWPEHTKKNQRNWIGKSEGAKIVFKVESQKSKVKSELEVFTTRPDTLFGVTYMVIAPEHELIENQKEQIINYDEVTEYTEEAKNKPEMERLEGKEKTGVKLEGLMAVNPANGKEIPIFVADYVLGGYGTGAIMAVPAHDERDFEFSEKYNLSSINVIAGFSVHIEEHRKLFEKINEWRNNSNLPGLKKKTISFGGGANVTCLFNSIESCKKGHVLTRDYFKKYGLTFSDKPYIGDGILINSGKFDGMTSEEAKQKITEFVGGEMTSNYRLRDWSISRQRYWGAPIPIVYSPEGEAKFVGEENLPWLLPEDVDFVPTGTAPLAKSKELKERTEKLFGEGWTPEVDTMDTFVDSSWYFLRYPDTENEKEFCSQEKLKRWLPVDLYIGGAEHTYMHLLYARFFVKAMHKMKLIDFDEPFLKLRHQGMVLDKDGVKMSKSKGNVINPNDMVEKFGADATRMYMMFATPLEDEIAFKEEGVKGVFRFLEKSWRLVQGQGMIDCGGRCGEVSEELPRLLHKTIKGVTEDIEGLKFNTAISKLMIFVNEFSRHKKVPRGAMEKFLILLSPFAPHIAEELWALLQGAREEVVPRGGADSDGRGGTSRSADDKSEESIFDQQWPKYNPEMIQDDLIEMPIQINGKVRDKIQVPADISEADAREKALASEKIKKHIDNKEIKKVIFVKGRLISIVA